MVFGMCCCIFFGLTKGVGLFRAVEASWDFPVHGRAGCLNFVALFENLICK